MLPIQFLEILRWKNIWPPGSLIGIKHMNEMRAHIITDSPTVNQSMWRISNLNLENGCGKESLLRLIP